MEQTTSARVGEPAANSAHRRDAARSRRDGSCGEQHTAALRPHARALLLAAGLSALSTGASAQLTAPQTQQLGAAYAQMVDITSSDALTSATYGLDAPEGVSDPRLRVVRFPVRLASTALDAGSLLWQLTLGYMELTSRFRTDLAGVGPGSIDASWITYGATLGSVYQRPLAEGVTFEFGPRLGLGRLWNSAVYSGVAVLLQPSLDGTLFNWRTDVTVTSFALALIGRRQFAGGVGELRGQVAHSRVATFRETNSAVAFNERASTFTLRGEFERVLDATLARHALYWSVISGYTRFFGANGASLGFNNVTELGAGLSLQLAESADVRWRVRLSASVLRGSGANGWTVGLSLRD